MHTSSRGRPLHAWVRFAILLALAGCREATAPLDRQTVVGPQISQSAATDIPIVQQAATAPSLETYRVSFWARHDRQSTVTVNYRSGQPLLHFHIPKFGLMWGPDETRLRGSDSILITLTIDTRKLSVDFQPSGVEFSKVLAPLLTVWYANASPDLNGDGAVDAADQALEPQLALWSQTRRAQRWRKLASKNDTTEKFVSARLYHFSEYAVCW